MFQGFSLGFCLALLCFGPFVCSACPSQCSCFYHKLSDGSKARSVLCNDPQITLVPPNFPADTSKLRIEKTAVTKISSETFHYLNSLEFLWMSFNSLNSLNVDSFRGLRSLDELRLEGNALTSFPWESLTDMPDLRLLDLHNNKISSIPAEATIYIKNLTYLDLSSNSLATVPPEVLSIDINAGPLEVRAPGHMPCVPSLHDNPWLCDCRLYELVQFQKSPSSSVVLMDTKLRCADPESLSGVLFSETELQRCQGPRVHTAVARVRSSLGNNVLLRCGTIGVPVPELSWTRADGKQMNGTVQEEVSKEGIIWSILSVPAVSYRDSGKYMCKATNFVGTADAIISLVITDSFKNEEQGGSSKTRNQRGRKTGGFGKAAYQEKLVARYIPPLTTTAPAPPEKRVVRSVKVIGDTDHTVSLNWRAPTAKNTTEFSVLYAVFGERDMRRINVGVGKNRITIDGLVPRTKYIACVCIKGLIPKKEQCVIFSTDEAASASGTQKLINVVVITVACVIAVPLTLIVCCGALKKRCKKLLGRKSKDIQDSYVTFETLSPGQKPKGMEGEYLARRQPDESNRLLSARSSVDSGATCRNEGPPNEYFC
uniref:Leucine-rich repeat, immunoglobulin-like domain and transmembrane domain-containing protein 1 n=1 Tax=Hucho hucho TaxID=62062 RepID=A0A4W5NVL2_9TELE